MALMKGKVSKFTSKNKAAKSLCFCKSTEVKITQLQKNNI